ncbi:MAG TPA: cupin domain-containing protein [Aggregatilineales bacterium]|nr:cupin domain-containing protein [Anaerolineales bacterium]HRE48123.1 cupin domain-containing protein [Aggregatilineales bacterium]
MAEWVQMNPAVKRRIVLDGEKMMVVEVHFEANGVVGDHSHPHEQITQVRQGRIKLTVNGVPHILAAGDIARVPGNVVHSAEALEASELYDVFSPPREDFRA